MWTTATKRIPLAIHRNPNVRLVHRFMSPCFFVSLIGAVMFAGAGIAAASGSNAQVEVVEAKRLLMAPQTWVTGTVSSRQEARLAAEVTGKVVLVKAVGTRVKENGVVARIDPTVSRLKVEELQSQVQESRTRLSFLKDEIQDHKLLAAQNKISQTRLDELRADREVARNELRVARERLKRAREDLRRYVIRSPFAGVVAEHLLGRGERAAVGDDVVRVIDAHALEVQARVPSVARDYVHEGMPLTLSIDGREISALVSALMATDDGGLGLRISLENAGWVVGHTVRVVLPTGKSEIVLAVPRDALLHRADVTYVFRINADNRAQRVAVKPGVTNGALVGVSSGEHDALSAGDRVVIRGAEHLQSGSTVKILDGPAGAVLSNGK